MSIALGAVRAGHPSRLALVLLLCGPPLAARVAQTGEPLARASEHGGGPTTTEPERFRFVERETGIGFTHHSGARGTSKRFMIECIGTGLGLVDVDDDGDLDLYLVQGGDVADDGAPRAGPDAQDALYLNDGAGRFTDAGAAAGELGTGFGFGVTAADVDGDDDEDLFVANLGPSELLLNDGRGRFTRAPGANGLAGADSDWAMCGAFADADGDGDLDAYVTTYLHHDLAHPMIRAGPTCRWVGCEVPCGPKGLVPQHDRFYLNDGSGHFVERTREAGLHGATAAYSFQAAWCDFDRDGDPDLLVANDSVPQALWRNDGMVEGVPSFTETAMSAGVALSDTGKEMAGMGLALGDVDADGRIDVLLTNFSQEQNAFFHNESDAERGLLFFEESSSTGLGRPSWFDLGWGASFLDADLDGDLDAFVANGHVYPQVDGCAISATTFAQRCQLYEQVTPARFAAVTLQAGPGLAVARAHRGSAVGDVDGDGDADVLVATLDGPPVLLVNDSPRLGTWVAVDLRPKARAVGARVRVTSASESASPVFEVLAGSSFLSSEDRRVRLGVPADATVVAVAVRWRDGRCERWEQQPTGRVLRLSQGEGTTGADGP